MSKTFREGFECNLKNQSLLTHLSAVFRENILPNGAVRGAKYVQVMPDYIVTKYGLKRNGLKYFSTPYPFRNIFIILD